MLTIILEGENKTGKSTLAKYLKEKFGFKVVKCSQPKGDPYVEYVRKLKAANGLTVFDRFLYGELVYGPLYRDKSQLTPEQVRNLELLAMAKNTIVVHCTDEVKNILKRFKQDKEDFATTDKVEATVEAFNNVILKSKLPKLVHVMKTRLDLTKKKKIDAVVKLKNENVKRYTQVIGNTVNPKLILVGDDRNLKAAPQYNHVALPFDFGPASEFLYVSIEKARLDWYDLAITNSTSGDLRKFIRANPTAKVVALGENAKKKLEGIGVQPYYLHHPMYYKRFKHSTGRKEFSDGLRKIYLDRV